MTGRGSDPTENGSDPEAAMTSEELIREAREATGRRPATEAEGPPTSASDDLIRGSRVWLEASTPIDMPPAGSGMGDTAEPAMEYGDDLTEPDWATPPRAPAPAPTPRPTRPAPAPAPASTPTFPTSPPAPEPAPTTPGPMTGRRTVRSGQRGVLIGALVVGFALLANLAGVLSDCVGGEGETPGSTVTLPAPSSLDRSSTRRTGTLTNYPNPCTGERIEGVVDVFIVYEETGDPSAPGSRVAVTISGSDLDGSSGNTYEMSLEAETVEPNARTTYVLESDAVVWSTGGVMAFTEKATVTVTVADGEIATWDYSGYEAACAE